MLATGWFKTTAIPDVAQTLSLPGPHSCGPLPRHESRGGRHKCLRHGLPDKAWSKLNGIGIKARFSSLVRTASLVSLTLAGAAFASPQTVQLESSKPAISQEQADALLNELRQIRMLLETRLPPSPLPAANPVPPAAPQPAPMPSSPALVSPAPAGNPSLTASPQPAPAEAAEANLPPAASAQPAVSLPGPAVPSAGAPGDLSSGSAALAAILQQATDNSPRDTAKQPIPQSAVAPPPAATASMSTLSLSAPITGTAAETRHRVRVGVVTPKLDATLASTAGAAELVRSSLISYLGGPAIDVQMISSMLPQQIDMEANDKACMYVLFSSLGTKKSAGVLEGLLGKAAPLANLTPIGAIGSAGAAVTGGKKPGAPLANAAEVAQSLKPKDQVNFEFTLREARGGATALSDVFSAQATRNGEDVVTPLVERVAGAVLTQVMKKPL